MRALPLTGLRVLDLSTVVFGPYAGQWLADLGAEVIKVEAPGGDTTRQMGPAREVDMAAFFLGSNRNKLSVGIDLKMPAGRDALHTLVGTADVFLHNMRPQKIKALGFDAQALCAAHPRLVYASCQGFGEDGPYAGRPAYDDVIQGMSGLAGLFQYRDGQPAYTPSIMADKTCGLVGAMSIMSALLQRERTGQGCHLEVPMFETMAAFNLVEHMYGHHFTPPEGDPVYPRMAAAWRRPYPTADGFICMLPYTDAHWQRFFTANGHPELARDPRFQGIRNRTENIKALYSEAARVALMRTTEEWLAFGLEHEIPMTPMNSIWDVQADPHLQAVGFFTQLDDAQMGPIKWPSVPIKLNGQRPAVHTMAPRLGQHTMSVMQQAGYSAEQVHDMLQEGAIFAHAPETRT